MSRPNPTRPTAGDSDDGGPMDAPVVAILQAYAAGKMTTGLAAEVLRRIDPGIDAWAALEEIDEAAREQVENAGWWEGVDAPHGAHQPFDSNSAPRYLIGRMMTEASLIRRDGRASDVSMLNGLRATLRKAECFPAEIRFEDIDTEADKSDWWDKINDGWWEGPQVPHNYAPMKHIYRWSPRKNCPQYSARTLTRNLKFDQLLLRTYGSKSWQKAAITRQRKMMRQLECQPDPVTDEWRLPQNPTGEATAGAELAQ